MISSKPSASTLAKPEATVKPTETAPPKKIAANVTRKDIIEFSGAATTVATSAQPGENLLDDQSG